ncbi:MAG TPA: hypothetical protein VF177_01950, partial [Anaerolineae bacterium]
MPAWSVIVLIVVANLILGWLILRQFGAAVPRLVGNHLDTAFAALFIGVAVLGWLAFVLAELGWFSVATLGLIWLLLVVSLAIRTVLASDPGSMDDTSGLNPRREEVSPVTGHRSPVIRRPSSLFSSLPNWIEPVALGVWLVIASWLFFRPHQFVTGAADAGAYVNLSAEIAQNGRILIHDDLLATLDPALYPLFLRWLGENAVAPYYILPGFYVMDVPTSTVVPQFYHLHPVWQAIAYGLAGSTAASVHASLLMSGLWALLGALTLYLVVRHFAGWQVALLALLGLSFNALQIWFARYPTTETLSQFVLWGGLWGTGAWLSGRRPAPLWAVLGGLGLGQFFLVRIDAFFIVPVLVLLGVWTWAQQQKASLWFFLPLGLLIGHSLVHGYWQSRPYFFDLFGFGLLLLRQNWLLAAAGAVIGIIFVWAISHFRGQFQHLGRYQQSIRLLMIIAVLLFAAYGWFVRPYSTEVYFWTDPYSTGNIPILDH